MHYKKIFALAGIFLAVALITPIVAFYYEGLNATEIFNQNIPTHQTQGNATATIDQITMNRQNTIIIVAVIETVFVVLFIVTMYYGINHMHPGHQRVSLRGKEDTLE
jgi:hypothetical protein